LREKLSLSLSRQNPFPLPSELSQSRRGKSAVGAGFFVYVIRVMSTPSAAYVRDFVVLAET